uniref:Fibronectin type-II domain-containing protein n=1 Tax=Bos mutus grunniens TaxID=30521 RepID=A0A8B9YPF8_BOSMU
MLLWKSTLVSTEINISICRLSFFSGPVLTCQLIAWVYHTERLLVFSFPVFSNYSCIFPFVYDDIVYYSCVSVRSDYAWCSIDEMFQGRWRYYPPSCTFPFLYRNKYFFKCTKEGYVLSRSWCSLTRDYNKDGKWKQCSPYQ